MSPKNSNHIVQYIRTSIMQTTMHHFNVQGIQINKFVSVSELSDKIHCLRLIICVGTGSIIHANMLFNTLYYDIISPTSVKIHRHFIYFLVLQKIYSVFWDFKIQNSVRITKVWIMEFQIIEILLYYVFKAINTNIH